MHVNAAVRSKKTNYYNRKAIISQDHSLHYLDSQTALLMCDLRCAKRP